MTNFDIFTRDPQFASFADVAVNAERILKKHLGRFLVQNWYFTFRVRISVAS